MATIAPGHKITGSGAVTAAAHAGLPRHGAAYPFADFYHSITGAAWVDWLFMIGVLGVGIALAVGIGMRIAAATGALLYVLMWSVVLVKRLPWLT
jgi:hypothetical protein